MSTITGSALKVDPGKARAVAAGGVAKARVTRARHPIADSDPRKAAGATAPATRCGVKSKITATALRAKLDELEKKLPGVRKAQEAVYNRKTRPQLLKQVSAAERATLAIQSNVALRLFLVHKALRRKAELLDLAAPGDSRCGRGTHCSRCWCHCRPHLRQRRPSMTSRAFSICYRMTV